MILLFEINILEKFILKLTHMSKCFLHIIKKRIINIVCYVIARMYAKLTFVNKQRASLFY